MTAAVPQPHDVDTPVHVVRRYLDEIYHDGRVEIVREICADPVVRHDPGRRTELSHQDQIDRIGADLPQWQPFFTAEVLAGDAEFAVLVWHAAGRTAERTLSGIEVFRVVDGRITDVWNTPYSTEPWG
ncbi:MAG: nuclear transport factor 2 family protein [Pseudonocardia sp.]|uniref:nuclear transport factor 2 family protein n=1 Tax=unclassified Pseudonocardia TaxID=2619320 RepID=UPI00086BB776|nr:MULTISPECIES: nuclear transport factor 2 family protein [unclassified Pseudonocardia]MBN9107420.1 nuclear transport factor 2 family protein [Pseudonocardia sp.]ODU05212.1 MAG: hypothetical protein ABS80_25225 [Pseudonocardia sp. SCN 72-51]ODV08290.1 MAG: hypothetical protein ABT15_03165 [Pseudonocardia sp. SCN 73-27]